MQDPVYLGPLGSIPPKMKAVSLPAQIAMLIPNVNFKPRQLAYFEQAGRRHIIERTPCAHWEEHPCARQTGCDRLSLCLTEGARDRSEKGTVGSSLFQVGELARTSPAMR